MAARYAKSINTQLNLSNSYILSDVIYLDVDAHGTDGIGRIEIYQFKYKSTVSSNDKLRDVYVIDGKIYVNEQIGNYSKDDLTKYAVAAVIAVMGYEYPEFSDDDVKIIKSERLSVQEVLSKM